ncbi:MAG: hypothetical protein Q4C87_10180 [Actinomycetaceae bacterium]|nr:hypothetical protein [Actinomycetaceae bacterium]
MKVTISIPDDVFAKAEDTARRLGWTRSRLYSQAIEDFIGNQGEDPVTAALDAIADEMESEVGNPGRAAIEAGAWEC